MVPHCCIPGLLQITRLQQLARTRFSRQLQPSTADWDVHLAVVSALLNHLWRHPVRGAYEGVTLAHGVGQLGCHAKVSHLYLACVCQQDVATLDVPVHLQAVKLLCGVVCMYMIKSDADASQVHVSRTCDNQTVMHLQHAVAPVAAWSVSFMYLYALPGVQRCIAVPMYKAAVHNRAIRYAC